MRKIAAILCMAVLLTGCRAEEEQEILSAQPGQEKVEALAEESEEKQETEQSDENWEVEFRDLFVVESEGIDYLSVEGIEVSEGSLLAMVGKNSKSEFWKEVKEGAAQAVADLNEGLGFTGDSKVELLYDAPENEDVAEQIEIIDQMLDKNPDALCIGFVDVNSGRTQLDLAQANGIPVLAVDSGVKNSQIAVTVKTDNYLAGAEAAREVCEAINYSGKIAVLVHNSQTESGIERERGFLEALERDFPQVELVNVAYGQQDERSTDEIVASVLLEHPDLDVYFGTNDNVTNELLNALELYGGEESRPLVAGFDASAKQIEAVVQDKITGVMAQNPYAMGYAAATASLRQMAGLDNAGEVFVDHFWIGQHNLEDERTQRLIYK